MISINKIPLVIVAGPTASGKTALGIQLAKKFNGEVISADSMQIYKNLDIGTAKPSTDEMDGIVHHMIDIVDPQEAFSVERYCYCAKKVIADIHSRGKLPIMVGGTGLYIDNTVLETSFSAPKRDEALTNELRLFAEENGNEALYEILRKEDPQKAATLHPNDVKRVIRAIETVRSTGKTRSALDGESRPSQSSYNCLYMAIDMDRDALYQRIESRVDIMIDNGLENEVRDCILPNRKQMTTALAAIGYREMLWYFKGLCTFGEATELIKRNSRRYAKRQLTWLRRNSNIVWLDVSNAFNQAQQLIRERILTDENTN